MKRTKYTTTLTNKARVALDLIKDIYDMTTGNEVIEYLLDKEIRERKLEEKLDDTLKENK